MPRQEDASLAHWIEVYLEHLQARKLAANSLRAYRLDLTAVAGDRKSVV